MMSIASLIKGVGGTGQRWLAYLTNQSPDSWPNHKEEAIASWLITVPYNHLLYRHRFKVTKNQALSPWFREQPHPSTGCNPCSIPFLSMMKDFFWQILESIQFLLHVMYHQYQKKTITVFITCFIPCLPLMIMLTIIACFLLKIFLIRDGVGRHRRLLASDHWLPIWIRCWRHGSSLFSEK